MKNNIWKQACSWLVTVVLVVLSVGNLIYLHHEVMGVAARTSWMVGLAWDYCLAGAILDVAIIFFLGLLITWWRPRLAAGITFVATLLWTALNAGYARLFHQYFPLSALRETGNITTGYYVQYIRYMVERSDCYLLLALVVFSALVVVSKKWLEKDRVQSWWLRIVLVLTCFAGVVYQNSHTHYSYTRLTDWNERYQFTANIENANEATILQHGCIMCQIVMPIMQTWHTGEQLSEEDMARIDAYIRKQNEAFQIPLAQVDTTSIRQKNIIFLLLESFLSYTIDLRVDGQEVTPTLNRLRHLPGTYYNGRMASNIAYGESSDGKFIYMTGLYPFPHDITVATLGNTAVHGLPHLLKKHGGMQASTIAQPSSPSMWRQSTMNVKYGIDTMRCFVQDMWDDAIVLDSAYQNIIDHRFRQPSFHLIVTATTHAPYHDDLYPWDVQFPEEWPTTFRHYLQKCHYADAQIGRLLERLEQEGMLENTILVAVADHQPKSNYIELPREADRTDYNNLPCIIAGANIDTTCTFNGPVNQIDLYPTLLDLYGIRDVWPGIGCSLLRPESYHDSYWDEGKEVSHFILRSDYLHI